MDRSRLPAYARDIPAKDIYATNPHRFLMWWELYVGLALLLFCALYLPWAWIGQWTLVKSFVSVMEHIVPSIGGLEPQYRYIQLEASKARLSFIHLIGISLCVIRLITLPLPVFYEIASWRFLFGAICALGLAAPLVLWIFLWDGIFREPPGFWYSNNLAVILTNISLWVLITFALAWTWGFLKELRRRHNETG
jgi:hypothetical protein